MEQGLRSHGCWVPGCNVVIGGPREPIVKDNKCSLGSTYDKKTAVFLCSVGTGTCQPNSDHKPREKNKHTFCLCLEYLRLHPNGLVSKRLLAE